MFTWVFPINSNNIYLHRTNYAFICEHREWYPFKKCKGICKELVKSEIYIQNFVLLKEYPESKAGGLCAGHIRFFVLITYIFISVNITPFT